MSYEWDEHKSRLNGGGGYWNHNTGRYHASDAELIAWAYERRRAEQAEEAAAARVRAEEDRKEAQIQKLQERLANQETIVQRLLEDKYKK